MIRNTKDFWTGVIYIAFGAGAIVIASDYGMGSASRWDRLISLRCLERY